MQMAHCFPSLLCVTREGEGGEGEYRKTVTTISLYYSGGVLCAQGVLVKQSPLYCKGVLHLSLMISNTFSVVA